MIASEKREEVELAIRNLCEAGDKRSAATLLLETYGREILGFLISFLRDRDTASEVFSDFTEAMWCGLDGFRWTCTVRAWCYTIARHAASHHTRKLRRRRARHPALTHADSISDIADRVRTATLASSRTEARSRIAQLREQLPQDAQALLILRINRRLAWTEIAQVMLHDGEVVDTSQLERDAVRLRKRYQIAKEKLRALAVAEGLVPEHD